MAIDGYLTRSVRETAALVERPRARLGAPYYAPALSGTLLDGIAGDPRRLRIACSHLSFTGDPVHPDCRAAIDHTAALSAELGHEIIEADPDVDIFGFMRSWTNIVACGTELTVRSREAELADQQRPTSSTVSPVGLLLSDAPCREPTTSRLSTRSTTSAGRWLASWPTSAASTCC